jgi:hypothetical protein
MVVSPVDEDVDKDKKNLLEKIKEAGDQLRPTFRTAWPYVLLGAFVGSTLLLLQFVLINAKWLPEASIWARMLEHMGVGFLVSSIAVFGYEWSGHIHKTLNAGKKLIEASVRLDKQIARIHKIREERDRSAIEQGFKEFLGAGDQNTEVIEHFMSIVDSVHKLAEQHSSNFVKFISVMLDELIVGNANTLVAIGQGNRKGKGELPFQLDSASCAMRLLTAQMDSMDFEDEYLVVSDIVSWEDNHLDDFQDATRRAIARGVTVKRVFNLVRDEKKVAWEKVEKILKQHYKDAQEMKSKNGGLGYEVRYILKPSGLSERGASELDLSNQHFGLFVQGDRQGDRKSIIRIKVNRDDLSDLSFWRNHHEVPEDRRRFERIWNMAELLNDEAVVTNIAARWNGSHHVPAQDGANALLDAYEEVKKGRYAAFFGNLAKRKIDDLLKDLRNMAGDRAFYEVIQIDPVQHYISIFVDLMYRIILPGSEFSVVTNELIWAKDSFGNPDRRYLDANVVAAKTRGVKISRVFIAEDRESLLRNREKAEEMLKMLRDHEEAFRGVVDVDLKGYFCSSREEYRAHFDKRRDNFAIWKPDADTEICTLVQYRLLEDGQYKINSITFDSNRELISEKRETFRVLHEKATRVGNFIKDLELIIRQASS